jgi:hypothetical protein
LNWQNVLTLTKNAKLFGLQKLKRNKNSKFILTLISITSGNSSENITISREVLNKTEAVGLQDLLKSG